MCISMCLAFEASKYNMATLAASIRPRAKSLKAFYGVNMTTKIVLRKVGIGEREIVS